MGAKAKVANKIKYQVAGYSWAFQSVPPKENKKLTGENSCELFLVN